ncbi:hypothetical protein SXCC_01440 [Gluconacetobacter sp. SXCC-1]|nr:hypothetical protein SXCC_01440 [Gluconacetobacter sp. SXCC-1]
MQVRLVAMQGFFHAPGNFLNVFRTEFAKVLGCAHDPVSSCTVVVPARSAGRALFL